MKIACWSGPRNISTALMRSWSSRIDTVVIDEPFYASYLNSTKLVHPMHKQIIKKYPSKYEEMIEILKAENPKSSSIWYQKHMAHHLLNFNNLDFILSFKNSILIRHPKDVILSYTKKNILNDEKDLGYPQQYEIIKFLKKNNQNFIIINSETLLQNPELILRKWCSSLEIDFDKKMLTWEKGTYDSDGIWAQHWYDSVVDTNGFQIRRVQKNNTILDSEYFKIYSKCLNLYNEMDALSIR